MNEIESLLSIYEKMLDEYKIRIIKKDGTTGYEKTSKDIIKIKKLEIKNEKDRI